MPEITSIRERLVFNSRGDKTIEIDVTTDNKYTGRACAPSGASVGMYEAQSFVNNDPLTTLSNFKNINKNFIGLDSSDLRGLHEKIKEIDSSDNYSNIGGSVAYALTIASIDSASKSLGVPFYKVLNPKIDSVILPYPLGNVLGGGAHAGPGTPDLQEFLICPIVSKSIEEAITLNSKIHKALKKSIEKIDNRFTYGKGDEGGWAPNVINDKAIELVERAIVECGYDPKSEIRMGIDFASSSLWNQKKELYEYVREGVARTSTEQLEYAGKLIRDYHLIYAEDPLHEEDFESMAMLTKENPKCLVTGDDLLVTNKKRVNIATSKKACSGAILKVNQAGTLYDAMEFANECNSNNIKIITSHRSGESVDNHISHIAIATNSVMIKTGVVGGERVSKLNELLRISEYGLIEGMAKLSNV
ncbi:MAG TPA: enolase [Candidatus Nitrosocosmicus sp.]|nr:enolase [Candidatus Nitrosocosmicus sp.]